MSIPHLLALFKDRSCPLLPTIARHCPRLPAKKMLQAVVASQYGRGSRGPERVPRAAPRQPGCTVEQTNHEPGSFLARAASRREFRGLHETRDTKYGFIRRGCTRDAQSETAAWNAVHATRSLLSCALWRSMGRLWRGMGGMGGMGDPSRCFPVHDCSPLFTIVRHCSRLFGIVQQKILRLSQYPLSVLTGNGAGKVFTNHETEDKNHGLYAFHETRNTALPVHWPSDISSGANQASQPWFSRNTRHETRITAFYRVLRPSGGEKCRLRSTGRQTFLLERTRPPNHGFYETRDTKHESRPFIVCFGRRVVRNAG